MTSQKRPSSDEPIRFDKTTSWTVLESRIDPVKISIPTDLVPVRIAYRKRPLVSNPENFHLSVWSKGEHINTYVNWLYSGQLRHKSPSTDTDYGRLWELYHLACWIQDGGFHDAVIDLLWTALTVSLPTHAQINDIWTSTEPMAVNGQRLTVAIYLKTAPETTDLDEYHKNFRDAVTLQLLRAYRGNRGSLLAGACNFHCHPHGPCEAIKRRKMN